MTLLNNAYIYGIYIQNELVYIGQTTQPIQNRIEAHVQRCHSPELKEALLKNQYTFKILYESHNAIEQATLNHMEEMLIITNQPKYNKCGVTMPYHFNEPKILLEGGGIATILAQKHYYSDIDIQQLLQQNAQISCAYICLKDEYKSLFFNTEQFSTLSKKDQNECINYVFGEINKFNTMVYHGTAGFRQSSFCVKEEDGSLRFPTIEEKANGIPKAKLQNCHIVFFFKREKDYENDFSELAISTQKHNNLPANETVDSYIDHLMESSRLHEAYNNTQKNIYKYYPLKIISMGDENLDTSYFYVDTWQESMC